MYPISELSSLPYIAQGNGWVAIHKPADVALEAHPWWPDAQCLLQRLRRLKGLELCKAVYVLDAAASGLSVLAYTQAAIEHLRNAHGSNQFQFSWLMLASERQPLADSIECDLPVVVGDAEPRLYVSHKHGKQAETRFQRIERLANGWQLWQASTQYMRLHQVRLHAHEVGLRIAGECCYDAVRPVYLSDLKPSFKGKETEKPLYGHLALHLATVQMPGAAVITAPLPKAYRVMLSRLGAQGH